MSKRVIKASKMLKKLIISFLIAIFIIVSSPFATNYSLGQKGVAKADFSSEYFEEIDFDSLENLYQNEKLNFTVRYPERWTYVIDEHQYTNYITFSSRPLNDPEMAPRIPDDEAKFELHILKNESSKDISTWAEEFIKNDPWNPQIKNSWNLNIGGQQSILHILSATGMQYYVAYIPHKDKVLLFIGPTVNNRYTLTFLQMLKSFNGQQKQKSLDLFSLFSIPTARAGYLSSPLSNFVVNSWLDHSTPLYGNDPLAGIMTRYDGLVFTGPWVQGVNWYNGHDGIDLSATTGIPVYAAGDGTVTIGGGLSSTGGYWLRVWHSTQGYSTYYGHLSSYAIISGGVLRGQLIAYSGATGVVSGPHFHFGVYNSQNGWYDPANGLAPIDPYGWTGTTTPSGTSCSAFGCAPWTGTTTDPWPYNQGYLWTTNPPSLDPPTPGGSLNPVATSTISVSGTITQNTTWTSGNVYAINGSATVNAGVTLTVQPGVVVKFKPQAGSNGILTINGTLNAQGLAANKIYFTSFKDDSVGGDTNGDGNATNPTPGDWQNIYFNIGSTGNFSNIIVKYGGGYSGSGGYGALYNLGGNLNVSNSEISFNSYNGIHQALGFLTLTNVKINNNTGFGIYHTGGFVTSTLSEFNNQTSGLYFGGGTANFFQNNFHDHTNYGVTTNPAGGTLLLSNNSFSNNPSGAALITGPDFIHYGNSVTGTGLRGWVMGAIIYADRTLTAGDLVYIIDNLMVATGKTLTINPGVVVKFKLTATFDPTTALNINGILTAQGTPTDKIYFTSIKDDSVGGDTNGDGSVTSPAALDFKGIRFNTGSTGNLNNAVIRYGGANACYWPNPICSGGIKNLGGQVSVLNTRIDLNYSGVYQDSGTTTVSQSSIENNNAYGIYNNSTNIISAINNWWGTPTGPYHPTLNASGTGNQVSNNVNFTPWLNYDPTNPQPCVPSTGC